MCWKRPEQQLWELILQKDLWSHGEQLCPVGPDVGGLGGQVASMRGPVKHVRTLRYFLRAVVWTPESAEACLPAPTSHVESYFTWKSWEAFAVFRSYLPPQICKSANPNLCLEVTVQGSNAL